MVFTELIQESLNTRITKIFAEDVHFTFRIISENRYNELIISINNCYSKSLRFNKSSPIDLNIVNKKLYKMIEEVYKCTTNI